MNKLVLIALALCACTADEDSKRALRAQGFTDVVMTGYEPFGCGKDDTFSSGFKATNVAGQPVSGVVCCGLTKKCTVRF